MCLCFACVCAHVCVLLYKGTAVCKCGLDSRALTSVSHLQSGIDLIKLHLFQSLEEKKAGNVSEGSREEGW